MSKNDEVTNWLIENSEQDFRVFSSSLIPDCKQVILGVRLPKLRRKAKEIVKGDWKNFICQDDCNYMEEILLQGMVIGLLKLPLEEHLVLVKNYVPKITNWSLCDSFCCGLKFANSNAERVWDFLQPYLASRREFELRFGVVMLLNFFINEDWIDKVLEVLFSLDSEDYYAQMGIAWAISVCFAKFFDKTYEKLYINELSPIVLKKSIQKSCESFRLTKEQKHLLRMRKKSLV